MVNKLLEEIEEIEAEAGNIPSEDKDTLYDMLVIAFFKAKDVIVALQENAPEPTVTVDTDEVDRLTHELAVSDKLLLEAREIIVAFKTNETQLKEILWKE